MREAVISFDTFHLIFIISAMLMLNSPPIPPKTSSLGVSIGSATGHRGGRKPALDAKAVKHGSRLLILQRSTRL